MASLGQAQTVRDRDIFHGLPTFPDTPEYKDLTAIVTGASGISGQHMIRALADSPERWTKVYALARRPPPDYLWKKLGKQAGIVKHIPLDFFTKPEDMGKTLHENGVKADYIFYFAYTQPKAAEGEVQWSNAQEMADQNTEMLVNFLKACDFAGFKPRRFMLQTGAKNYGLHLGPNLIPQFENDPRVGGEPNFYYPQEDALKEYCSKRNVGWNVARPSFILGAVGDNLLNHLYGLAIYASVQGHLKRPLQFPASLQMWDMIFDQSSAYMNAYLEEWMVLNPDAANQAFNAKDDSHFTWGRFWPMLARWYGTDGYTTPELDESKFKIVPLALKKPPRGWGPEAAFRCTFSLVDWAKDPQVQAAWKELASKHNIKLDPFEDIDKSFALADGALQWEWGVQLADNKARKLGWHGFCDSFESAFRVFEEFAEFGLAPPMIVKDWGQPY